MSSNGTFEFINGLRLEHWANGHVLVDGGDGYIDGGDNENGDADVCGDHDPSMKPVCIVGENRTTFSSITSNLSCVCAGD